MAVAALATPSLAALVAGKSAFIDGCYALSRRGPRAADVAVPVALTAMGAMDTTWNLHVLLSAALR